MKKLILSAIFMLGLSFAQAQTVKPTQEVPVCQYYEGGKDSLYSFVNKTVVYPPYAKRNRIAGEIILSFTLEANGQVTNIKCTKDHPRGGGLSAEAIRVLKLIKFTAPGFSSVQSLPVIFKL